MSRGLGRREQQILRACRHAATEQTIESWWVSIRELVVAEDQHLRHTQYVSFLRAARSLVAKGWVEEGEVWATIPVVGLVGAVSRERKLLAVRSVLTPEQQEIEDAHKAELAERRRRIVAELKAKAV
jgi:hypothetical protein